MIAAEGLVVGRRGFRVGPFDFEARAGTLTVLIGPNGGGKTTLLRTLAGLASPIAGRVRRADEATPALLPAPGALDASFPAEHMVALGRAARRGWGSAPSPADRAAARDALAGLGVLDLAPRPFDRLSSGQRQLVLLARLVAQGSPVRLLDEPSAMLDPAQAFRVEEALLVMAADGRTIIASAHDLSLAARADLVVAVGPHAAAGPPAAMLTPATLSALYGAPMAPCPTCGQPDAGTTRAS